MFDSLYLRNNWHRKWKRFINRLYSLVLDVHLLENNDEIKLEVNEHETLSINGDNEDFMNDNNNDFVKSEVKKESRQAFYIFNRNGCCILLNQENKVNLLKITGT